MSNFSITHPDGTTERAYALSATLALRARDAFRNARMYSDDYSWPHEEWCEAHGVDSETDVSRYEPLYLVASALERESGIAFDTMCDQLINEAFTEVK